MTKRYVGETSLRNQLMAAAELLDKEHPTEAAHLREAWAKIWEITTTPCPGSPACEIARRVAYKRGYNAGYGKKRRETYRKNPSA